ncbi:MAG: type II toxin-antitoxin system RelB/DinJ family antitoxin [Candidatus Gracilibacteria bacterium]|nr:type II toxin-antitoxin system RelB/DinJ family antitoxin [Candidatus Gracilibacteria bacterium]
MSQKINVNIRIDKNLKENASLLAEKMGTNLSALLNMFLVKFTIEKRFEIGVNPETEFINLDNDEIKKIEGLPSFNTFMSNIQGK